MSPEKCITGKQPHCVFSCGNVLSHLMTKISHILIGISFGFILWNNKPIVFSADTICIVHPGTQPIHTKTGPIAAPWCRFLTQGLAHSVTFTGMALCSYSNKGWQSCIMSNGITKVQQIEYPDKIFPTAMEFLNSMWLKLFNSQNPAATE